MSKLIRNPEFRKLCGRHGVEAQEVAHVCGVSPAAITHMLNGKHVPRVARAVSTFFFGKPNVPRLQRLIERGRGSITRLEAGRS
jgi:hypothetical protein